MTEEGSRPNYYEAIIRQRRMVRVGREPLWLASPSAYQYTAYEFYSQRLTDAVDSGPIIDRVAALVELLRVLIGDDKMERLLPRETVAIMLAAKELYVAPPLMAWQKPDEQPADRIKDETGVSVVTNLEYDGRDLSVLVTVLARAFGWSAHHILHELSIYEACIYAQEAMLQNHEEREWMYMLSEVGFKKIGDNYEKQRLAQPSWIRSQMKKDPKAMTPIPEKFLPGGGELAVQGLRYDASTGRVVPYAITREADAGTAQQAAPSTADALQHGADNSSPAS